MSPALLLMALSLGGVKAQPCRPTVACAAELVPAGNLETELGAIGTTTVSSATNFLRAVREGHAEAVSRPLHAGRSTIVVETEVRDAASRLVAKVTQTQAVLLPR